MKEPHALAIATLVTMSLVACNNDERTAKPEPAQSSATTSAVPIVTAPPPAATGAVSGIVAETMDAGGYTYVRLTTDNGEKWAAVPLTKLTVGDKITVVSSMVMKDFASPTLKRTFPEILFGTLAGQSAPSPSSTTVTMTPPSSAAAASGAPIAKAAGPTGRTVAEVFAGKTTLKDKPVLVRGRVVKFNAGILGKNWIHIVDGSGSKSAGDNDLTVTTATATPAVGEVIVVRGVLHLDRDFGGGYTYAVIVEDATIEK